MSILDVLVIAFVLSLDAFSVSISCGIKLGKRQLYNYGKIALVFGLFQALMPLGGGILGNLLKGSIGTYAPWISFVVFFALGVKTFFDVYKGEDESYEVSCKCDKFFCLFNLGVATSIDAFLVGIILSLSSTISFYISLPIIGVTTILMSFIGCHIGNLANRILKNWAQVFAGVILIILAIKSIWS